MGKPGAFLDIDRVTHELRPVEERSRDFDPLYVELDDDARRAQASRCMMCGVAFCQMGASFGKARPSGCPLDRKSTRLNSSHLEQSRMPSSA